MELKIKQSPDEFIKTIDFNYDEIKAEMADKVEMYKTIVYTDGQIKEAKADRAELNKMVKAMEDKRKEIKALCLAPYEKFEKQMKELVAVVNEPIAVIDEQIKAYEAQQKENKRAEIEAYYNTLDFKGIALEQVFDNKWLNVTASMASIKDTLDKRAAEIAVDMKMLSELPEYSFEAVDVYKRTVDIRQAMAEVNRLTDVAKRKAEAQKVEIVLPTLEVPKEDIPAQPQDNFIPDFDTITDNRATVIFKVKASPDDIEKVEQFLSINKISFERVG